MIATKPGRNASSTFSRCGLNSGIISFGIDAYVCLISLSNSCKLTLVCRICSSCRSNVVAASGISKPNFVKYCASLINSKTCGSKLTYSS